VGKRNRTLFVQSRLSFLCEPRTCSISFSERGETKSTMRKGKVRLFDRKVLGDGCFA